MTPADRRTENGRNGTTGKTLLTGAGDTAMTGGREWHGFPKKMADRVTLDRDGPHVAGSVVRNGTELLRIEGKFADPQRSGVHPPRGAARAVPIHGRVSRNGR